MKLPIRSSIWGFSHRGFSLVELVVVVTILSILSLVAYVSYSDSVVGARDSERSSDLEELKIDLKSHKQKEWSYPLPVSSFTMTNSWVVVYQWLMNSGVVSNVLANIPKDPRSGSSYSYSVNSNRQQFQIALTKENQGIPKAVVSGDYKSVAKDLFPTMLIAYSGITSIDMSGASINLNRNKFILDGGGYNLPYDMKGNIVSWGQSFAGITTEIWVTMESGGNYFSCSEIYEAGRAMGPGTYQIVSSSWTLTNTGCLMDGNGA